MLLALAGCGAFAAGVIRFGAPVKPSPYVFPGPRAGNGTPLAGTERLLPVATPDPRRRAGVGHAPVPHDPRSRCVQVGRVLDGKFGALGQDGAFEDDRRFHEVPVNAPQFFDDGCANLDAHGRTFMNLSVFDQAASGWFGRDNCVPANSNKMNIPPGSGICEQDHERDLYYGLLGPDAQSITYTSKGHSVTQATSGPKAPTYSLRTQPTTGSTTSRTRVPAVWCRSVVRSPLSTTATGAPATSQRVAGSAE